MYAVMSLVRNDFPTPAPPLRIMWNGLGPERSLFLFTCNSWEYLMIKLNVFVALHSTGKTFYKILLEVMILSTKREATDIEDGWLGSPCSLEFKSSKSGLSIP